MPIPSFLKQAATPGSTGFFIVCVAVWLALRSSPAVKACQARRPKKHGKQKTLGILAAKLGRAVYPMLRKNVAFDVRRFLGQ